MAIDAVHRQDNEYELCVFSTGKIIHSSFSLNNSRIYAIINILCKGIKYLLEIKF